MAKVQHIITNQTKYFKFREEGTDNWYAGKTDKPTIPQGAYAISFYEYMKMAYGKAATFRAMKEMQRIMGVTKRGSIEIGVDTDISHLPSANDEQSFSKIINGAK